MIKVIPVIQEAFIVKDRCFRLYSDGKLEMCDLSKENPAFEMIHTKIEDNIGVGGMEYITINNQNK